MPDALIVDLAKKVVERLGAASYSQAVSAVLKYRPIYDLRDLNTLHVTVAPKSDTLTMLTRNTSEETTEVDIGVQMKIGADSEGQPDSTAIEPLLLLVEDIKTDMLGRKFTSATPAICVSVTNEPIYDPDHLEKKRTFTSVITLGCRFNV